jgi:hypothetical protein
MMVSIDAFLNEGGASAKSRPIRNEHKSDLPNAGNTAHFYMDQMPKRTNNIKNESTCKLKICHSFLFQAVSNATVFYLVYVP